MEDGTPVADYIDELLRINQAKLDNAQFENTLLLTFTNLDPTKLQECATAMSELAESAQKVKDVPWQEIVNGVNNINNIETPNEDLATASTIMRTVQASLSVVAATDDTVAAEIISPEPIQRTVQLLADTSNIQNELEKLKTFTLSLAGNTSNVNITSEPEATATNNIDNNTAISTQIQETINKI